MTVYTVFKGIGSGVIKIGSSNSLSPNCCVILDRLYLTSPLFLHLENDIDNSNFLICKTGHLTHQVILWMRYCMEKAEYIA